MSDTGLGAIINEELNDAKKSVQRAVSNIVNVGNPLTTTPQQQDQKIADLKTEEDRYKEEELKRIGMEILHIIKSNDTPEEIQKKLPIVQNVKNEHFQTAQALDKAKQNSDQQATSGPEIPQTRTMTGSLQGPMTGTSKKLEESPLTTQQQLRTGSREGTKGNE